MSEIQIRDARPGDQKGIETATLLAYGEYADLMAEHWEEYRRNILSNLANVHPAAQIVADEDGQIVGAVLLYPAETAEVEAGSPPVTIAWPEVRRLAVSPTARGRGMGEALMQECIRRARLAGSRFLTLHTTDIMESALKLYARMGFQRTPDLDFEAAPGLTIKGYRLDLEDSGKRTS